MQNEPGRNDERALAVDPLDERVLFYVLDRLSRAFQSARLTSRIVSPTGLTIEPASLRLLARIASIQPTRGADLAADLALSASTISRQLRELDDHGFLQRTADPADGRSHLIVLSPAGEEVNSLLVAEWRRLAGTVFAEWSDAERMALHDLGLRLVTALDAAAPPAL